MVEVAADPQDDVSCSNTVVTWATNVHNACDHRNVYLGMSSTATEDDGSENIPNQ